MFLLPLVKLWMKSRLIFPWKCTRHFAYLCNIIINGAGEILDCKTELAEVQRRFSVKRELVFWIIVLWVKSPGPVFSPLCWWHFAHTWRLFFEKSTILLYYIKSSLSLRPSNHWDLHACTFPEDWRCLINYSLSLARALQCCREKKRENEMTPQSNGIPTKRGKSSWGKNEKNKGHPSNNW